MREATRFFDRITSIELIFNGFKCGWKWFQSERLPGSVKKSVLPERCSFRSVRGKNERTSAEEI